MWPDLFLSSNGPMFLSNTVFPWRSPTFRYQSAFSPLKRASKRPSPSQSTNSNVRRPLLPAGPLTRESGRPFSSAKIRSPGRSRKSPILTLSQRSLSMRNNHDYTWHRRGLLRIVGLAIGCSVPLQLGAEIDFNRDIRPILSENCFLCHGPDDADRKGDEKVPADSGWIQRRERKQT